MAFNKGNNLGFIYILKHNADCEVWTPLPSAATRKEMWKDNHDYITCESLEDF
jgi:hypothetical protein